MHTDVAILGTIADGTDRVPSLDIGSWVRVDSEGGAVSWTGHISYVNGEILGLRGATSAEDLFALRDNVTMHVGREQAITSSQARVLAASGRMLRILIRRAVGDLERRGRPAFTSHNLSP